MGRRAADLTAPVPVLGVPALAGVRGWRTTAGERTALLQSWGPQCSIGVQTSPAVGRPPVNYSMQLTYDNDSGYKEVLKSEKEKGAILKLKTRSSKTKKEVTFKTAACEASRDVTCSLEISQTHCHSKEISGHPHPPQDASIKSKLKPARYSNGSVVDSDAIGGISVDNIEGGPVASSGGKKQDKPQSHHAEKSGRPLLLPGAQTFRTPQKICGQCGGRQSDVPGIITLDQKSACLGEKGVNLLLTTDQFPLTELEHKLKPYKISDIAGRDERPPVSPRLYVSEEFMRSKIGAPPCPLHSSKALFTQRSTFVSAETVNVTKATNEASPPHCETISQAARLHLTPQKATATKANIPHSHTHPQGSRTHRNLPMSVCVSVHAAPDTTPPSVYTTAAGAGTLSITNTHKRSAESNAALAPAENATLANAKFKTQSSALAANVNANDGGESKGTQMTIKCGAVSQAPRALDTALKLETAAQIPPCSGHKPQQRSWFSAVMDSSRCPAISSSSHSTAPHVPLSTSQQSPWKQNSDKLTHHSTKPAASQCQPKDPNKETTVRVSSETPNAAFNSSNNQNSSPPSGVAPASTSMQRNARARVLGNSLTYLKSSPPPAVSNSTAMEGEADACASAEVSLQPADETQHNRELGGNNTNPAGKGSEAQIGDELGSGHLASAEENSLTACPAAVSGMANLPEYDQRDTDASHSKSHITPRKDSHRGGNKISGNPIRTLVTYEAKPHKNSSVSQVTGLRNYFSLIKPGGSCPHARVSTGRRCEGYSECAGACVACPAVNPDQQIRKVEELAARPADVKPDPSTDKHAHHLTPFVSTLVNPGGDASSITESLIQLTPGSDSSFLPRARKGPELSTLHLNNRGDLHSGPGCNPTLPSLTMDLPVRPRLQSTVRPDSKSSLPGPRSCPGNTTRAHSHPAGVARLLPPSPQCCKSASLQQKLESVEASLAANKDRITTLLNIIHDLETSHTPSSG